MPNWIRERVKLMRQASRYVSQEELYPHFIYGITHV